MVRAHVTAQSWGQTVKELKAELQKARESAFVLCTSAADSDRHPKDNLYMWGHYANGHRGGGMPPLKKKSISALLVKMRLPAYFWD